MSDYLSNLAARSLDQADTIRPRPLPLFAPEPRAAWPTLDQSDDLEFVDRGPPALAPRVSDQSPVARPAERRMLVEPAAPAIRALADHLNTHSAPLGRAPVSAAEAPRQPALKSPAPQEGLDRVVVERVVAPVPPPEQLIVERMVAPAPALAAKHAESQQLDQIAIERIVTPSPPLPPSAPSPSAPVIPGMLPAAPMPIVVKPHVAAVARVAPRSPVAQASEQAAREPTPTIQVTIGRIEVRATPPSAQPARAARGAAPSMSLDEYLRSRNGGAR